MVFAGNTIQTLSAVPTQELFQEVSNAPSAMMTIRSLLAACAMKDFVPKVRRATQAYIQSRIDSPGRPATWIRFPRAWWPSSWFKADGSARYTTPVVRLGKALYVHPEAGAIWEKPLKKILIDLGWTPLDSHPGFWTHVASGALLAVYVDDLLLGATANLEMQLWKELASRAGFGDPPEPIAKFLGAHHRVTKDGDIVHYERQMEDFLIDATDKYMNETGVKKMCSSPHPVLDRGLRLQGRRQARPSSRHGFFAPHEVALRYENVQARFDRRDHSAGG